MRTIVAHLYHEIKAIAHDAARALATSPPATPGYQRVMLLNRAAGVSILGVA